MVYIMENRHFKQLSIDKNAHPEGAGTTPPRVLAMPSSPLLLGVPPWMAGPGGSLSEHFPVF